MPYIYTEIEVDLSEFDTEDLIEELESRGSTINGANSLDNDSLLTKIWELRRLGKSYEAEVDLLIYNVLGKVI